MELNRGNLDVLFTGYKATFQNALAAAEPQYARVATTVPSQTASEVYAWLGQLPSMREWIGDREVGNLQAHEYTVRNKSFEMSVAVSRDSIQDDQYGIYSPMMAEMGRAAAAHADQLVFGALKDGWANKCYDGRPFFDTKHKIGTADTANTDGGSGAAWFLMDASRAVRPIVYQTRKAPAFVALADNDDDAVFRRNEYLYGVDSRAAVGYGLWQLCWGSKQTLDAAAYEKARGALLGMKGDRGRALGLSPRLLVVPPALEKAALEILNAERDAAGKTNVWRGTAALLVSPWLA